MVTWWVISLTTVVNWLESKFHDTFGWGIHALLYWCVTSALNLVVNLDSTTFFKIGEALDERWKVFKPTVQSLTLLALTRRTPAECYDPEFREINGRCDGLMGGWLVFSHFQSIYYLIAEEFGGKTLEAPESQENVLDESSQKMMATACFLVSRGIRVMFLMLCSSVIWGERVRAKCFVFFFFQRNKEKQELTLIAVMCRYTAWQLNAKQLCVLGI